MNYSFEFNSSAMGRIQPFEYSYATTNEYAFTYSRDILSDLSKFNAPIFVARRRRGIFSYDKIFIAERDNKYRLKIQDSIRHSIKTKEGFDIYKDLQVKRDRYGFEILTDNLFANKDILVNILKELLAQQDINNTNIYDNYFGEKYIPKRISITNIKALNKDFSLEIYDDYFMSTYDKELEVYKTIFANKPINKLNIYNRELLAYEYNNSLNVFNNTSLTKPNNTLYVFNDISLYKPISELSVYKNYLAVKTNTNIINVFNSYFIKIPIKELDINNSFMVSKINNNNIFIKDGTNITRLNDKVKLNLYKQLEAHIDNKDIMLDKVYIASKENKRMQSIQKNIYADSTTKNISIYNKIFASTKESNLVNVSYKIPKLAKYKKRLIKSRDIVLGYHPRRKICFRKENLFAYKFDHNIYLNEDILLSKDKHSFSINDTDKILYKDKHGFSINDSEVTLKLARKGIDTKSTSEFLYKDKHGFRIFYDDTSKLLTDLIKSKKGFDINNTETYLYRDRYGFSINDTEKDIIKTRKGFVIDDYTDFIYRDKYHISIDITDANLAKSELPVGIIIHDNTIGLVISEKDLYKDNNEKFLNLNSKHTFNKDTQIFLDKDAKRTNDVFNNIFVITEQKKVFLDYYHNLMMSKNIKSCLIDMRNTFVEKKPKHGIIYKDIIGVTKRCKKAFINTNVIVNKNNKELFITDDVFFVKTLKNTKIFNDIWVNKETHTASIFKDISISKDIYEAYVSDKDIMIDKAEFNLTKESYIDIDKKNKDLYKNKDVGSILKSNNNFNVDNYVFITKQQYKTNEFVSEMEHIQKVIKDLERPVEKTYNWAYVYQYEDPIDPNYDYYGIDELLLPEKDVDYSTFEEIIFNKKTMMPKRPVKVIDNNTFIAKYPIKHPIPNYEEIGIVYIDVPTDLMYTIFTKFYQVWYANIFKFGNMSMVDSLKLMLDYMYSYIVVTYSGSEYLEPALRVFRQIRWFGETSVMHNAQYKITCEYEDLKSNLQTGTCMIKNDLSGFYVDKALKVLSTDSTSIGHEAYIKLYASNREDSQITFSVSFTGGALDVYLNNTLIDTIYSNHASISYDLPATNTENEIILKRSASNNIGHCYVGNIIIKKGTYKNLNIEYDPDLKAGNMPLNDIVNKMVILANMYDDEQEAFNKFREGNLAVSELYKRLENYWELHHANKIKGKRLTIKET